MNVYPDWAVSGGDVLLFINEVAKKPPPNWSEVENPPVREFQREASMDLPAARLLFSLKKGHGRIANIVPRDNHVRRIEMDQYDAILKEFCAFAEPIAISLGLAVERKSSGTHIRRWLSPEAEARLRGFANHANKSTGSGHPTDRQMWLAFIIRAHLDNSGLNASTLERFMIEDLGWSGWEDTVLDLVVSYEFGRDILAQYDKL